MAFALLLILMITCGALLFWGLCEPERILEYPFLAATVFSGWAMPQLVGLSVFPEQLPEGALVKTILMTLFCLGACYFGYALRKHPIQSINWSFDQRRLLTAATFLSLGGAYFYYRIGLIYDDAGSTWTGIITIFHFFSQAMLIGMSIALVIHLIKPSYWSLTIVGFDLLFFLNRIIFQGRRRALIELLVMISLAMWFRYRKLPSRPLVVSIILVGMLWVNSIGDYRAVVKGKSGFDGVAKIDFVGNLKAIATEGGHEMRNAAYNIAAYDTRGKFDFGTSLWNDFIHLYIPGQFIGDANKQSLKIPVDDAAYEEFSFQPSRGSTPTGMSDSFQSFWYFGAVKFLIIGYVLRALSISAARGHIAAQILIILLLPGAMESITHGTERFYMAWPRIILFLGPALVFARLKTPNIFPVKRYGFMKSSIQR